jgi:glycosyltransferase involved in cell wall biosynthesis
MKSILFISEYFYPKIQGGGEINLLLLSKALAKKGIKVTVLTSWFPGTKKKEILNGVNILRLTQTGSSTSSILSNIKRATVYEKSALKATKRLLKHHDIDIIHLIGSSIGLAKNLKQTKIPIVATIESYIALCPKGDFLCQTKTDTSRWSFIKYIKCLLNADEIGKVKNNFYIKYNPIFWLISYKRFLHLENGLKNSKLIAISKFVKNILKNNYNKHSTIIPNFVDIKSFKTIKRRNKKPVVTYLGTLAEHKGPHVLLKAIEDLDCAVKFYGAGPLKKELEQTINKNGFDAEIKSPVHYHEVPKIYSQADIVVFPSLWPEPFGRIAIESLASGTPVIGSSSGAIPETIPPGTGILVEPGNIKQLHDSLQLLLAHPKWRKERGEKGRTFTKKHYEKDVVVKKLIKYYKEIIS